MESPAQIENPLKAWRLRCGYSQEYVAHRLKVSMGTIARWETWQRFPEHQYFQRIYKLTKGEITPNSFARWLVILMSQSTVPLASPVVPQLERQRGRRVEKEAPDARQTDPAPT